MKLPRLAIENVPFTIVLVVLLTLLGVVSFFTMPRSEDPQFDIAVTRVVVIYPGATAEDIESLVVDPLEAQINEVQDIKKLETTIEDGVAVLAIEFLSGTDPNDSYDEVVQAVNTARSVLPPDVLAVETFETSPTDTNILQLALVSEEASYRTLQREAERLEKLLERSPGVKRADVWAFPDQEVRVGVDLEQLGKLNIPLTQVIGAIQANAQNIPGGNVDLGDRRFNIQTSGDYGSVDDIGRTIVAARADRLVYLQDVADVALDYADETHRARLDGERAVFVTVAQRTGTNIFDITEAMQPGLAAFETALPEDVRLVTAFDQAESVDRRVNGFFGNLLQGIVLVGLVVLFALGVRAAVIVMLAIPTSILIAINWVDLSDYGLQQISIVGLVIALGLLVDNAIVVTENVTRYRKQGLSLIEAAIKGTAEVGWPVVSATVTSVLAFLPMVLVQSGSGDFIRSLPVTVIYALAASLLVSLTLTPMLASRFLEKRGSEKEAAPSARVPILQRWLGRLVVGPYRATMAFALRRPWVVLATAGAVFLGSLALFPLVGVSLFPKAEKPQFLINVETPGGSSLDRTDEAVRYVESLLHGRDDVRHFASNVGRDNPRIYYNIIPRREQSTVGQVMVELNRYADAETAIPELQAALDQYPGAEFSFIEFENGPPVEAPIAIKVIGPNLDVLAELSSEVEHMIQTTEGTLNVDNPIRMPKTDLRVNINREKAGLLGVPLVDIDRTVRAGMAGLPVATYRDSEGEDLNIVVRLPLTDRPTMTDFDRIEVASMRGTPIPLRQVATVELERVLPRIDHFGLERAATVTSDVAPGYSEFDVTADVLAQLEAYAWPSGYRYFVGGKLEAQEESFGSLGQALVIAIFGILSVLVLQFRSFRQSVIIFVAIPLALVGAVLGLLFTGYTFSFTAFIGLTSLVGIVVNNSIILVDYANHLRTAGQSVRDAVQQAGETRFIPIILTTLTTIGGLLPLTLTGSSLWSPLGVVIIGGLVGSTLLTLVVVPVLYALLTPEAARV